MKYYAKYTFNKNPKNATAYILDCIEGEEVPAIRLAEYKRTEYVGKKYMLMTEPRKESMRKYFAYTFEMFPSIAITSTEELNEKHRTFGDGKKYGRDDLILFQFSDDLQKLEVYFVKDKAKTVMDKKNNFKLWNMGEKLELIA